MFLKTADYTVRIKKIGGEDRYFIKYHGQTIMPECEIDFDMFSLYVGEFYHTQENQRNERRRHIEDNSLEHFDMLGKLKSPADDEEMRVTVYAVEAVLKVCTEVQRRRFRLHFHEGYSYSEIAEIEGCAKNGVSQSVESVMKKIKKYFS